jgi:hypothetical protein
MNTWRINQNDLSCTTSFFRRDVNESLNAATGRLGLVCDYGEFLARKRIQQSGFAGVGTAKNADVSGAKGHACGCAAKDYISFI